MKFVRWVAPDSTDIVKAAKGTFHALNHFLGGVATGGLPFVRVSLILGLGFIKRGIVFSVGYCMISNIPM